MIKFTPPEGYFESLPARLKKRRRRKATVKALVTTVAVVSFLLAVPPLLEILFVKSEQVNNQQLVEEYILDEVETELVIETLAFNQ